MKMNAIALAASLLAVSGLANAKADYVNGVIKNVNTENNTVSISLMNSGKVKTYRYVENARYETANGYKKNLSSIRRGEHVTLQLETVNAAR
jgi:hypothetical protein